jgi:predicted membrane-bound spermidine synthase
VAFVHVTVAALVTAVQVSQAFPFFQDPALHVTATEFEALVHVTVAALLTAVQVVHVLALSQVPSAQVAVHVSMAPVPPTVFLVVEEAAQAETRESEADVHV